VLVVEIGGFSMALNEPVDRTGSSAPVALQDRDGPSGGAPGRLALELPHQRGVVKHLHEARGNADVEAAFRDSCFEHANGRVPIFGQPVGKKRAGRSRSDDDVVKTVRHSSSEAARRSADTGRATLLPTHL